MPSYRKGSKRCGGSAPYSNLMRHNNNGMMSSPPLVNAKAGGGQYVVPSYSVPGYDTLTSPDGNCGTYKTISNAYRGMNGVGCEQAYLTRNCQ